MSAPPAEAATTLSWVVPTIGFTDHLAACLDSIWQDASALGAPGELIVVRQRPCDGSDHELASLGELLRELEAGQPVAFDRPPLVVELPRPVGFARAANEGIARSRGAWIALVNDDVTLMTGWAQTLLGAVDPDPEAAAAQGVNLAPAAPGQTPRVDGAGLAWNRRWQAVQLCRGEEAPPGGMPRSVYGVSATAAIYRREALLRTHRDSRGLRPFDQRLHSYYEDVDLADRLHRSGYRALLVPNARAEHVGALSSRSPDAARWRTRQVHANRLLVLARRLGRGFWLRLPSLLARDALDALRSSGAAAMPGDLPAPSHADVLRGWGRAARLLPAFAHIRAASAVPPAEGVVPDADPRLDAGAATPGCRAEADPQPAPGPAPAPSEPMPRPASPQPARQPEGKPATTVLTGVVPHWHDEAHLGDLVRAWPVDGCFELVVVDNGSNDDLVALTSGRENVRLLDPGANLGFAAAVNLGAGAARSELLLLLNPDAVPQAGALEALVEANETHPDAAGFAPRLLGARGDSQAGWQLRRLPTFGTLLRYCCFVEPPAAPEPATGDAVEQPAACALLLRRTAFESIGGMDERFHPAWFEDVDLAMRLREHGLSILYWPQAVFDHGLGGSLPRLGYGPFLAAYYRNLDRYARKHHGPGRAFMLRVVLGATALLRIALLPVRRPRRARNRADALRGLRRLLAPAAAGWGKE